MPRCVKLIKGWIGRRRRFHAFDMESSPNVSRVDVVIGGAGFVGLSLAIALRQALGPKFSVVVADPALDAPTADERATAIAAAARRLFETIGVWDDIADRAQPILDMVITDSRLGDAVRPVFLTFGGEIEPGEPFAHMVENHDLVAALLAKAQAERVDLRGEGVTGFTTEPDRVVVQLAGGAAIAARVLVAADGARS